MNKTQESIFRKKIEHKTIDTCADKTNKLNAISNIYLNDLKTFCGQNNKTIIFFTSPELTDTCKDDNLFLKMAMDEKGLVYYDFTELFSSEIIYSDWKDFTHLSNIGAERFTKSIGKIVFDIENFEKQQ